MICGKFSLTYDMHTQTRLFNHNKMNVCKGKIDRSEKEKMCVRASTAITL